jgi:acyl transferase domain-containing protein/acyl carrier protein
MSASELSPLKRAFLALQDAQLRIASLEAVQSEPVALIGVGARIPGAENGPDAFWSLLENGCDAVDESLPQRWHELGAPGADEQMPPLTRFAALLRRQDLFDAEFFGISPREAAGMDPQQRQLLEVSWHALEHAGIAPSSLYGSRTGVFVGLTGSDYSLLRLASMSPTEIDGHFGSDVAHSIATGRLSYILGLRGPSVSIDTACSSSLVSIHLAAEAIRRGECDLAIAGGVNAVLTTEASRSFARAGMLSTQGRCKSFAAGADGFVRGEGCGVVVLKRLAQAQADGDRILAVILGSAINHDGPSSGLTVPSGTAQQAVVRQALAAARIEPGEVGYVETHGTGTSLGDPIEAEALGAVFGGSRPAGRPLAIGAVKTNIGHLEAAAGVAGVIKVVLALQHGELPAQLHFDAPSPHIRWDKLELEVVDSHRAWEPIAGRRIAGVSSFGFSGTNAHIVIGEAPRTARAAVEHERPIEILSLSARSETALRELAAAYRARLEASPADWANVCHTAGVGRARFAQQLSVRAENDQALRAGLTAYLDGTPDARVVVSESSGVRPKIAFLFTGQGAQYVGMGRALYAGSSTVRRIFDEADALLGDRLGVPLGAAIRGEHPEAAQLLNQTLYTQPALYVLECALTALWRDLGVEPFAVIGHSLGEYAAAAAGGVFSFADGLLLVADRARLMHEVIADGTMLVVNAPEAQVAPLLAGYADRVSVAGVNAPNQVTISGARAAIDELSAACAARNWRTVPLPVSQAFHSPLLEEMSVAFEARAAQLAYARPNIKLISNLTGSAIESVDAAYWRAHTREAVRFLDGVHALDAVGCDVLVEVGPKPTLLPLAQQVLGAAGTRVAVATLKGPNQDWESFAQAVQRLQAAGIPIDWAAWNRDRGRQIVDAPLYPFERERHWIAPAIPARARDARRAPGPPAHALLGRRVRSALHDAHFEAELQLDGETAWLADHRVGDRALLPATAMIEMMLAAGATLDPPLGALTDLVLLAPIVLDAANPRTLQTVVDPLDGGGAAVRIFALETGVHGVENDAAQASFRLHAQGQLSAARAGAAAAVDVAALRSHYSAARDGQDHYAQLAAAGGAFGPAFRGIVEIAAGEDGVLAEIHSVAGPASGFAGRPHPALLDACLQAAVVALGAASSNALPFALERFELVAASWPERIFALARRGEAHANRSSVDVVVCDAAGSVLARVGGLSFRAMNGAESAADAHDSGWFYQLEWRKTIVPEISPATPAAVLVVGAGPLAQMIAQTLGDEGRAVSLCEPGALAPSSSASNGASTSIGAVVYVPPEDRSADSDDPAMCGLDELLALLRLHAKHGSFSRSRLYVVTRDLHAIEPADRVRLSDAAISGLTASAWNEFPGLRCTRIDVSSAESAAGRDVAGEIRAAATDDWVAFRGGARFAARLHRAGALVAPPPLPVVLRTGGSINSLCWDESEPQALGDDEIEIDVYAAPLNFRDVVSVVGLIDDHKPLGSECAGVVRRVGSRVVRISPGDEVVAIASGSFASVTVGSEKLAIRKPAGLSFEAAAAQTLVYLTADYALNAVAGMRAGQSALIHAGAGGVGLAAIALCRAAGVTVCATAGSESKRALLRSLGVERVMDSRSLAFAAELRAATDGRGVDIVLNSLAGDFVDASLSVTARGGHFIEIGKTDVRDRRDVAVAYPGVAYDAIDLTDRLREDPDGMRERLSAIFARIVAGEIAAVPHRSYSFGEAASAFRDLAAARHIGKLVLAFPRPPGAPVVRGDGSYIVTGGLAGIGLAIGGWLAERGAQRVVLVGRSAPSAQVEAQIAGWRERGVDVLVRRGDVGSYEDVRQIVDEAGASLCGIVHCANVLDDAPIGELTEERFATVMRPKAGGAWNLHRASASSQLDFFVLFSSFAAIAGARGAANYGAANVALDALAQHRHAAGLPALSLDWGAWSGVGWATRAGVTALPAGFGTISPERGLRAFETALRAPGFAQLVVAPIDWSAFGAGGARELPSVCADLATVRPRAVAAAGPPRSLALLADAVAAASATSRRSVAVATLQDLAAKALGIDDARTIDPQRPLAELGMDSILAVELRNMVGSSLGASVAATLLFDYPTVGSLADYALSILDPRAPQIEEDVPDGAESLLQAIEDLSDAEVDVRLARRGDDVA